MRLLAQVVGAWQSGVSQAEEPAEASARAHLVFTPFLHVPSLSWQDNCSCHLTTEALLPLMLSCACFSWEEAANPSSLRGEPLTQLASPPRCIS